MSLALKISEENKKILKIENQIPSFAFRKPRLKRRLGSGGGWHNAEWHEVRTLNIWAAMKPTTRGHQDSDKVFEDVFCDLTYLDPGQPARVTKRTTKLMKLAAAAADTRSAEGKRSPKTRKTRLSIVDLRPRLFPPGPPPLPPDVLLAG